MNKYDLTGKNVEVYLEGNWAFIGLVEYSSSDIIVLDSKEGSLVLYKNKIVAAKILEDRITEEPIDLNITSEYNDYIKPTFIPEENVQLNHYGSIIPEDMLEGEADPTPVSFSISMAELKEPTEKKNKYGPSKKVRSNREKNTK